MSNYISNKEFTKCLCDYINACNDAESKGQEIPMIPDPIARQFVLLANKLGSRFNFSGYSFRDEMVSNAILACCAKIRKFDTKYSNGFAYFTSVCWRAMVDVINLEEKMSYIKAKAFQEMSYDDTLSDNDLSEFTEYSGNVNDYVPFFDVEDFEKKLTDAKIKAKANSKKKILGDNILEVD